MKIQMVRMAMLGSLLVVPLAAQAQGNPYALRIDRSLYALQGSSGATASASAAAGATRPAPQPTRAAAAIARSPAGESPVGSQEQALERRIAELAQERDAWKLRADSLEAELRLSRGAVPPIVYPPPARR